jgi:hypothetical protein
LSAIGLRSPVIIGNQKLTLNLDCHGVLQF